MLSKTSKTICNSRFCTDYVRVKGKSFHHKGNVNNVTQANTPRLHSLSTTSSSPMTGTENSNKEQKVSIEGYVMLYHGATYLILDF